VTDASVVLGSLHPYQFNEFGTSQIIVETEWTSYDGSKIQRPTEVSFFEIMKNPLACEVAPCYPYQISKLNERNNVAPVIISQLAGSATNVLAVQQELRTRSAIVTGFLGAATAADGWTFTIQNLFVEKIAQLACSTSADCVMSVYHSPVNSRSDCYCPLCDEYSLNQDAATANQDSWTRYCQRALEGTCPLARCGPTPTPVCQNGRCA
jgi:hypothetical protein